VECPNCRVVLPETAKFCQECGTPLPRTCPGCGHASPAGAKFCPECGVSFAAKQAEDPKRVPRAVAVTGSAPERRQLTVMFCDMVGSSTLSTRLDPEEQGDVIAAFHACCTKEIKNLDGMVAQYLGDGVLAYFGYPTAHENDAERAILAGLATLKAVKTLRTAANVAVQTRIAIGSGVVLVGDLMREGVTQENAAIGETTNLVARLQAVAEPNSLVISPITHRLVGALFDYRDLGRHTLKGFPEPVHVRQVLGVSKVQSRFEAQHQAGTSPLLGREEELELLLRRWEESKRGAGRVVLVTGEPGIGKSRIVRALRDRLNSDPHTPLSYFCSPHHENSALYPHITQLAHAAGLDRDDSAEIRLDKLHLLLAQSSANLVQDMPLFAALLSIPGGERYPLPEMTPQHRKERTLAALLDQLKRLAAHQPILVVYEDLHWIDPTSLEALSLAIEQIGNHRILLIATARPEFAPPWPGHRHVSTLSLNRFGQSECDALITSISKGKGLPPEVRDQIVSRTDGVPLFVEELTKTVLESGLLRETTERFELIGPLPPLAIPSTLHASLLARLDRLAAVKDVAQIGAVIGRGFSYALLAAAAAVPEKDLKAALVQLVTAGLIYQRGVPADATYLFKHALVQDASYASLVRSRRQQLHGQVARALEEHFPDVVATEPETLAHHLTEAGLTESAVCYWLKASQRAITRPAYQEAMNHVERGLALIEKLPESFERDRRELDLLITWQVPLFKLTSPAGISGLEVRYERAIVLAEKLNDVQSLSTSLRAQSGRFQMMFDHRKAQEFAERRRALALRENNRRMRLGAHLAMAWNLLFAKADLAVAQREFEQALALHEPADLPDSAGTDAFVVGNTWLAWTLWISGHPERARKMQTQAFSRAAELDHAYTTAFVHAWAGAELELLFGNATAVLAHTNVVEDISSKHGMMQLHGITTICKSWALSSSDGSENGIALIQQGIDHLDGKRVAWQRPYFLTLLALARARAGDVQGALALCRDAQETVQRTEENIWLSELHRGEGEVRRAAGRPAGDIEACYERALEVSRQQGARMFELRAATALARLWREQGKIVEARDLLAPIYGWFTEGFDTVDSKAANALLDELSA
jgi:class 3 adenylate cyclase/tetratricopeptide (TPR) repeat protein